MSESMSHFRQPAELLKELGIEEAVDIDIEAIAQHCGATVVEERLQGCEARIVGIGDKAIITVNRDSPLERKRFSAGHELGHWMCDRGTISFGCTSDLFLTQWSDHNPERRANRYAANLLLPEQIFRTAAQNKAVTFNVVKELAALFRTSLTATSLRLVECGSFPSVIICTKNGKRVWFSRSPSVPTELWPREAIGTSTLAHRLSHSGQAISSPEEIDADEWISHEDSHRYMIVEDSLRIRDGYVLSLLWWKDEQQLLDLLDSED